MKVIIAGGGIGGLTLANALELAGIDFVLLEARGVIDPQVGASIAIAPGAMRIFDQMGAAQEVMDQAAPICVSRHHNKDGTMFLPPDDGMRLLTERFTYQFSFLDRQLVLRALANALKRKDRIILNKRVGTIDHREDGATVRCVDGTSYTGDLVVGCDGVNSKVRAEMWRIAGEADPTYFREEERSKMTTEYSCLFGISEAVDGFETGDLDYTYDKNRSFLIATGKNGRVYWFFFQKLDKVYHWHEKDFPRYTRADAERVAAENAWRKCHCDRTLGDVWEKRVTYTLVAMEEALFKHWSWGRIAVVGDNSHKMTANHGQAGNNAIESAAALANQLQQLHVAKRTSFKDLRKALLDWRQRRKSRVDATCADAALVCRMQALKGMKEDFLVHGIMPYSSEMMVDLFTDALIGAEVLDYVPLPPRSLTGTCGFNPECGAGKKEKLWLRLLKALPIGAISFFVSQNIPSSSSLDAVKLGGPLEGLVNFCTFGSALYNGTVSSSSTLASSQRYALHADFLLVYAIWLVEAARRANLLTPAQVPVLFGIAAQDHGLGGVAPWYYLSHYATSTLEKLAPLDKRLTVVAHTRTVLPVLLGLLGLTRYFANSAGSQDISLAICLLFPVLVSFAQWALIVTGISKNTVKTDRLVRMTRDVKYIYTYIGVFSAVSSAYWVSSALQGFPLLTSTAASDSEILHLLKWNWLGTAASSAMWIAYLFHDFKVAGMVETSWFVLVPGFILCSAVLGPVAAVALAWLWRENILMTKREKHAHTKERYEGRSILDVREGSKGGIHSDTNGFAIAHANGHVNGHVNGSK